ncbi:class I SAM-dependent methyltransferase [Dongia sp.]|uniref:class I SAM-dependent methyltransferase n=1 Tax=Dongia sp. TaxID=1977262 RepID=UPI0035B0D21A
MIYRILNIPIVYRAAQMILGPGAEKNILRRLQALVATLPMDGPLLDMGCGPESWLFKLGYDPVGLDIEPSYAAAYTAAGHRAVVGSAAELPFPSESFQCVWTFAMFHHLPDNLAGKALAEAIRVTRPGGAVLVFDSILPRSVWRRPLAYAIRRLDRGRFMRPKERLLGLLPERAAWSVEHISYAATGLEGVFCIYRKAPAAA